MWKYGEFVPPDSAFHPLWVGKMSIWWVMAIGGICVFQIGSLHQLGNQDVAALVLYTPQ